MNMTMSKTIAIPALFALLVLFSVGCQAPLTGEDERAPETRGHATPAASAEYTWTYFPTNQAYVDRDRAIAVIEVDGAWQRVPAKPMGGGGWSLVDESGNAHYLVSESMDVRAGNRPQADNARHRSAWDEQLLGLHVTR